VIARKLKPDTYGAEGFALRLPISAFQLLLGFGPVERHERPEPDLRARRSEWRLGAQNGRAPAQLTGIISPDF